MSLAQWQQTQRALHCMGQMWKRLSPCHWSPVTACKGQNYIVNSLVYQGKYTVRDRERVYRLLKADGRGASIDYWLNDSFPWIWDRSLIHYTTKVTVFGGLSSRERQYSQGIPIQSTSSFFYIQKLPTPHELWDAPAGDFDKINRCVVKVMMAAFQRSFGVATPVNKELSQTHEAIE